MRVRIVTFKEEEEVVEELDFVARRKGRNRSELIRAAIRYILRNNVVDDALRLLDEEMRQRSRREWRSLPSGDGDVEIILL